MTERELFEAALDETPDERTAFLDRACAGAPELRQRLEALLARQEQAGSFLEGAALEGISATPEWPRGSSSLAEAAGQVLAGRYQLLEPIGEGGMGTVWLALQTEPVRRQVAVKLIKAGMDSRMVLSRFEAERQALALMDHPNIAKVLDGGSTGQGRPFFVMEYVKGVPITQYCDDARLTVAERLELFIPVCQAVQHAHQKGVLHRDLKPSNLLICLYDGQPVPKVIDFGLAKAMHQPLTEHTLHTAHGLMLGTPLYMSPEQAALDNLDVDTRSDIYALGVVLYELLTGSTPLEKEQLRRAAWPEVLRLIKETEPPKPSTRMRKDEGGRMKDEKKKLTRFFSSFILHPSSFQELDWIVMKALDKERSRRYETANGLARDIARYLGDEPVEACPPSAWYRLRKLARRNRAMLTTAALVALALVLGTGVSVWQALRATAALNSEGETLARLKDEEKATRRELGRAQDAEKKATLELFESLVAQARANRLSRRIGQRFGTIEILRKATGKARQLKLPAERFLELRNEAIGALALPDLRVAKEWPDAAAIARNFDTKLERYARTDRQGRVQVRRAGDGKEIYRLADLGPGENWPLLSPDGGYLAVTEPGRRRLHVWRLAGAEPAVVFDEPAQGACWFSPDSRQLALQQADGSIGILDLATSTIVQRLPPVPWVNQMKFHPAGGQLALVSPGRSAQVRDLQTGKVLWQKNLKDPWPCPGWHPDGKILAVADTEAISLWDVAKDKQVGKLEGIQRGGIFLTFDPSGTLLASNSWAGILRLWDPLSNRQLFSTPFGTVAFQFSGDGRFLAATQHDTKMRIWEIAAGHEYRTLVASPLQGKRGYVSVAISPEGRFLAAGAEGVGGVGLWELPSGKELAFLEASPGINYVALEPRSPRAPAEEKSEGSLLTMGANGLLRWPIRAEPLTGAVHIGPAQTLPVPGQYDGMIAQSRDGGVLAAAQFQGGVVLHADQPDQLIKLEPHQGVLSVAVSPDGLWVVTGRFGSPGGAKVWRAKTGKLEKDLPGAAHCRPVFSPDGKRLVLAGYQETTEMRLIRRLEVETWAEIPFKESVEGQNPAFSPDGKLLVVETGSGTARLLDAETGREYARLEDPDQHRATHFAFTPDGTKLVCATGDGYCLHVWDLQAIRRQLAEMGLSWD